MGEPVLVATCATPSLLETFDSGTVVVPGILTSDPVERTWAGAGDCGVPGEWMQLNDTTCSELPNWDLIYRPPKKLKTGVWSVEFSATKNTLGGIITDPAPPPLYNGYMTIMQTFSCDPTLWCLDITTDGADLAIQESLTLDGTDAVDFTPFSFDMAIFEGGICCGPAKLIHVYSGPRNNDGVPTQCWSWNVKLVGTWISDFP